MTTYNRRLLLWFTPPTDDRISSSRILCYRVEIRRGVSGPIKVLSGYTEDEDLVGGPGGLQPPETSFWSLINDSKRPMGHIAHLRKQFKSINTYDYIITLIKRRKKRLLTL